ncbi:unnamed protein product, partial [Ectocarpus sp. 13 AM-2016]
MLPVRWPSWRCVECRIGATCPAFDCDGVMLCWCCRTPRCLCVAFRWSPPP